MSAYIKSHPIKLLFLGGFVLLVLRILIWGGLNMTGFCWSEKRWLSDDERISAALEYQNSLSAVQIELPKGSTVELKSFETIPYMNVDDLRAKNPECCKVLNDRIPGNSFWDRFFGESPPGVVSTSYIVHLVDSNGHPMQQKVSSTRTFSNCGRRI